MALSGFKWNTGQAAVTPPPGSLLSPKLISQSLSATIQAQLT